MSITKMSDLNLHSKRVLIREDFNVPIQNGEIRSDARIQAALPTIEAATRAGAKVLIMSHLGRPKAGQWQAEYSLEPIAKRLSECLRQKVRLEKDWLNGVNVQDGEVVLCENVRFLEGELQNDEALSKKMAALCDVFVMDAFGVAHRAQASTHGVARFAPIACAGPLLTLELEALDRALEAPSRPVVAIVAGSKVSTKLKLLESLLNVADTLILGGGIANTFLAAEGVAIGNSLHEADLISEAKRLLASTASSKAKIPLPVDVVVADRFDANAKSEIKSISDVKDDEMILDIGPETAASFSEDLINAGTIIWNGPVGVFEFDAFAEGTKALARAIATSTAFSIAGGGDTIAAIEKFGIADEVSYISTGGGAFLTLLEGNVLPAVDVLDRED